MEMTDARLEIQQSNNPMADAYLETAYLYLLDEFRKAFISDQVQRESRLYEKLSQTIGISDDSSSLKLFAQKMYALHK
jgi:hypothetical protein